MSNWYALQQTSDDSADLYIYDVIGEMGRPAWALVNELRQQAGKRLNVYINSPGGSVFDGIAIYNALARHEGGVNVVVDGVAASIASVIAQAGETRHMAQGSAMMVHDAWGLAVGNPAVMESMASQLNEASDAIADIYALRAGGTPEEWRERMGVETWYNAQSAMAAGLADTAAMQVAASIPTHGRIFNLSNYTSVPEWVNSDTAGIEPNTVTTPAAAAPSTTNGLEPPIEEGDSMTELSAIRSALGLGEDGDIIAAITGLNARIVEQAREAPDQAEAATLRADLAAANQRIISLETEHAAAMVTQAEELTTLRAEVRVAEAIGQGRITPASREYALRVARTESDAGWANFVGTLPSVRLGEMGSAGDGNEVEINEHEAAAMRQLGVKPEAVQAIKAEDAQGR